MNNYLLIARGKCLITLSLLLFISSVTAQITFQNKTLSFFTSMWKNLPQEKVYLHTDKHYYNAGEDIWFKAYVVNASTHFPNTKSKFVYVELINAFDSVVCRVKIKKDSLGFSGSIKLNEETEPGDYVLRAYTFWMQNAGSDFFFKKQINIGNSINDRILSSIKFGKVSNGFQNITIQLRDVNSKPISGKEVKITYKGSRNAVKPTLLKSNLQGEIFWKIPVDSVSTTRKSVTILVNEPSSKYRKEFAVPPFTDDFDVQFFPESGSLIQEDIQTVAFKATGTNGLSVNVSGKVYDSENNEITEIATLYKGMGRFSLFTQSGLSYYAILKSEKGIKKRFDLPKIQVEGVALNLVANKGKIYYNVKNQLNDTLRPLYLFIHSRGVVYALQPLNYLNGQIGEDNLPAGITSFSVVDTCGNVFCERLFFVKNRQLYNINISNDKNKYKKREEVKMDLSLTGLGGNPLKGEFSISVTDNKFVKPDSLSDNIVSHLLLSSDIKGYIEDPADFFSDYAITSQQKLDLLMLTQGWRRFELSKYMQGKFSRPEHYLEIGQAVSGKVLNLTNKPSRNCDIIMLSAYNKTFRMTTTDSLGQFLIDGFEFPDSTAIMLKARKKKSLTDVEIIPDADVFPKSNVFIPFREPSNDTKLADYWQISKEKYYTDGGMRMINLDELTVTASAKKATDYNPMYAGADNKITSEALESFAGMSVLNYLQMVPGVSVTGESVSIRGSAGNPLFLIDGFETESIEDIMYLTTAEVEEIFVFKGTSASIFGSRGGNGAIAINLKKGATIKHATPISLSVVKPLGFQKPIEFYMPKYDVEDVKNSTKADLRTTIFWDGRLKTDENGKINIRFYTADPANNYMFILEGVTENGILIHNTGMISRE